MKKQLCSVISLAVILQGMPLWADAPGQIYYRGQLAGPDASFTGTKSVTFSIWDAVSGGNQLFTETQPSVSVSNGLFTALMGSVSPIAASVFQSGNSRFLEIDVPGETTAARIPLASAPYAMSVAGINVNNGNVGIGTQSPAYRLSLVGGMGGSYGLTPNYAAWNSFGLGDGGASIYNDNGIFKSLMLVGNTSSGSTTGRQVSVWDYLTVNGGETIAGNLTVSGLINPLLPKYAAWGSYGAGDGGAAIYNDNNGFKSLMLVGNNSAGGLREVSIWDQLSVNGPATLNGVLPKYSSWASYGTGDGGAAIYNDNNGYKSLMLVGNNSAGGTRQVGVWDYLTVNGGETVTGSEKVSGGDLAVSHTGSGVILKATDNSAVCYRVTVNSAGVLSTASVACP